jgi:Na+/melibiose symporter-like transporter
MSAFLFALLLVFIILAIVAWPAWGHTQDRWPYIRGGRYRYYPSAGAIVAALLVILLFWVLAPPMAV